MRPNMKIASIFLLVFLLNGDTLGNERSNVVSRPGHYPPVWCQISNVMLSAKDRLFIVDQEADAKVSTQCDFIKDIWPIASLPGKRLPLKCDKEFDEGHVFTIFYFAGASNYYHLNYDMMIPLYQTLYHDIDESTGTVALLPSVETQRMKAVDWDTKAFEEPSKYWMQMMKILSTDKTTMMPLDRTITNSSLNTCFKELFFGTSKFNVKNAALLSGFAQFIKNKLHVLQRPLTPDNLRIGLITRSNRRRILNEAQLLEAIRPFAQMDLVRFEGLKIREQVALVQKYAIIIGVNGAGLMNAIFRPEHAIAIQLVPFEAQLNHETFGHILSATGQYKVWHNKHKDKHFQMETDRNNNNADTIVHIKEFQELVAQTLSEVKDAILGVKEEL